MHHDSENLQLANRHYLSFLARQELSIFVSQVNYFQYLFHKFFVCLRTGVSKIEVGLDAI